MFDTLLARRSDPGPALAGALAAAAAAIARLDEALASHPLRPAFLYRARLDAVRRQAAVDGMLIDPWHLAAVLEGFRLHADSRLGRVDRGTVIDAARHAFDQYQWLVFPDFDQEGVVHRAEAHLAGFSAHGETPLLAAASGLHAWLGAGHSGGADHPGGDGRGHSDARGTRPAGGARAPIRAALVRFWTRQKLLRTQVPLSGAAALRAETPFEWAAWVPAFLQAVAAEAADARQLLMDLELAWFAARAAVAGRRRDSHAAAAVDVLAAVPVISATSLAAGLGMAVKNAIRLLDGLVDADIAVEVTHRSRRRLFGLKAMAPLAEAVRPPYRPEPGRGRGRPPNLTADDDIAGPPPPLPPLTPIERRAFDYSELEHCMAQLDLSIRHTKHTLDALVGPKIESALPARQSAAVSPDAAEPAHPNDRTEHYV
jgi:hypothetical protein